MLRRRMPWVVALAAVVCLSVPSPASAQIGGFLKKKVKQAVKGQVAGGDSASAKAAPADGSGPRFSEYVLELNADNLDKLEKALAAEKAYTDSVNAAYGKLSTPEQYQQCMIQTTMDPEAAKITANMTDAASMQKAQERLMAFRERKCGKDPERAMEGKKEALRKASGRGAEAVGIKPSALSIMKERITPFCESGGQAKVKGDSEGMYYVYTPTEVASIQPRCAKLTALLAPPKAAAKPAAGRMRK